MKSSLFLLLTAMLFAGRGRAAPGEADPPPADVRQLLVRAILSEGGPEQLKLLGQLGESGDKAVVDVLSAWSRDSLYLYPAPDGAKVPVLLEEGEDAAGKKRAQRIDNGQFLKDQHGSDLRFGSTDLSSVDTDMRLRGSIQQTLDTLALAAPEPEARRSAALKLGNSQKQRNLAVLQARLPKETDRHVLRALKEGIALIQLGSAEAKVQLAAVEQLELLNSIGSLENLRALMSRPGCPREVARAAKLAIHSIEEHIWVVNVFGTIFHGISLGSILLVVALGLAITFGLMGIINMAHGEMIAVGAYACYVVQNLFAAGFGFSMTLPISFGGKPLSLGLHLPGLNASGWVYETYFLVALPVSFLSAALAGLLIERTVIRFLYRRPLESLLATWGISLAMQQCFRMVFGANNVQVNSPSWLLGHFVINDVIFGYNRVFVIGFAIVIVVGTWLLLTKTSLGLLIRAVMQNRNMAACVGVRTNRVNMLTFAFGSGLAGLAGAFLSQIGNVGPSLGQTYIVDSFMTVVLGGVGSIVGTVYSALGIGTADQVLQQTTGSPVTGKIVVLVSIIVFLQWKPGGLFSARSRSLD
ncbi:MAG TPA: urea ABC transporter permease subunit UrtB [Verrucomicrobiae bacterium]|nr:urea ABC transporter permease subunit UrtB [Verrucomicrobiae bacterium]